MKNNTTKQNEKGAYASFFLHLVSIVISAAAIIYLGYHFLNSFSTEVETEYALLTTENDTISLDAYILRSESIIYSTNPGSVNYLFSDGTKVKIGSSIADIFSGSWTSDDDNSVVAIDKKIGLLKESTPSEGLASSDTSVIDGRIASCLASIRQSAGLNVYTNLQKRRDELLTLINKRKIVTGAVEGYGDVIENLESERSRMVGALEDITETVTSPSSGFFYSSTDGYESVFTTDKADSLTLASFDEMIKSQPVTYSDLAVGKLTTQFNWFIVTEATRDSMRYFNEGSYYTVNFNYNNESIKMKLYNIVTEVGNERILLIFESDQVPENFSFRRMQPVEIVEHSYSGYKVPIGAVRLVNGVQGVYVLVGSMVEFRQIDVLLELDGYYIVAPQDIENDPDYKNKLGIYDNIIVSGKDMYVGKLIS